MTQLTRPDGVSLSAAYDGAGRPSTLSQPRGTIGYAYDPASGNLISITAPGGISLALRYDGSLITRTTWLGPVSGTVSAVYDADFRTASQSVNNTQTIAYTYDADGLLTQAGALALARDPQNGRLTGTTMGAVTTTQGYDAFGEVVTYTAALSGTPFYSMLLGRDALGRIVTRTETISGSTSALVYTYDAAGRLAQVGLNGTAVQTYTYDANGNRLSFSSPVSGTITGAYDAQDRLLSYGGGVYSYTANGEMISKTTSTTLTTQYQYDALGNLITATLPSGTQVTYLVDGLNDGSASR